MGGFPFPVGSGTPGRAHPFLSKLPSRQVRTIYRSVDPMKKTVGNVLSLFGTIPASQIS
jgi:hypothetical protein